MADSLSEYGSAPWHYLAQSGGQSRALAMTDWRWTSHFAAPDLNPLEINAASLATGAGSTAAIVRYLARNLTLAHISACFSRKPAGEGIDVAVRAGGRELYAGRLLDRLVIADLPVSLSAGDALDFVFQSASGAASLADYRIRLFDWAPGAAPACAA
jgi:hypothetical protein